MKTMVGILCLAALLAGEVFGANGKAQRAERPQHFNEAAGYVSRTLKDGLFLRFADATGEKLDLNVLTGRMPQSFEIACDTTEIGRNPAEGALELALGAMSDPKVGAVVLIVREGEASPCLAAYPEDRMAILNIDRLKAGLPRECGDEVFKKRLTKELWRAAAFALGGYESDYACALKAVFSSEDLDSNPMEMTCPPVSGHIKRSGKRLGFGLVQSVPYFIALRQGWAPEPINEAQRAEKKRYEEIMNQRKESSSKEK